MKKFLSLVVMAAMSISSYAVSITRMPAPLGSSGTSTVSVCNTSICTSPTSVLIGNTYSSFISPLFSIVITFDYSFYPGSPSVFHVNPSTVIAAGGAYVTYYGPDCDVLKIRYLGSDNYDYQVYTTCL